MGPRLIAFVNSFSAFRITLLCSAGTSRTCEESDLCESRSGSVRAYLLFFASFAFFARGLGLGFGSVTSSFEP
jgi:hypothetical protein